MSDHVVGLLAGRPTPGFRRLGVGIDQIDKGLTALEPTAQRSVWTMHPILSYDPANEMTLLDDHTRRRGVDMRCITTERSLNLYPLLTSEIPHVRFGPARSQFILATRRSPSSVGRTAKRAIRRRGSRPAPMC